MDKRNPIVLYGDWINKLCYVHNQKNTLFYRGKEFDSLYKMDESWRHYTKKNNSVRKNSVYSTLWSALDSQIDRH